MLEAEEEDRKKDVLEEDVLEEDVPEEVRRTRH